MAGGNYEGQEFTETVHGRGFLTGTGVSMLREGYVLDEADFLRLKNGKQLTGSWATGMFLVVLGFAISLGPKVLPFIGGQKVDITKWDLVTLAVGTVISAALWVIGRLLPNERRKLMKTMEHYFQECASKRASSVRAPVVTGDKQ
jgi:hypothetical protein